MYRVAAVLMRVVALSVLAGCSRGGAPSTPQSATAPAIAYQYKVFSLMEMFDYSDSTKAKVMELVVQVGTGVHRTDMDAADYEEAINRLASQGWELVTVNKSNYWVFRRPKSAAATQS